ncbi:MAG: sigma-70 family RNA polymerase sigma factor [Ruminococcaceae bacterium]|nr:sigma-70 family RNA polymerase sigma factor [Oscillospiraceae bacterium]
MSEQKNDIEIFDSEDDIIIESRSSEDLYDIKGNLITADDAKNTLPKNTDLIQKAIDGDKQAFNELYMQSYRYVFFVVKNYIPDDETAYDVIQESFIKVYKNISKLRSPSAYYGWITIIAKNTACDFVRAARFETSLSYDEEDYTDFLKDDESQNDVSLDIETVLKKLTTDDADLLSLVYYDGMRISQIAKMQGVPATTVYSRFNKAKRNLKAQLKIHGIDKAIYSGNFVTMITTAIRNIIGTALLSLVIAQQILDSIINGKGKKELAVAKIIRAQQKRTILKIASVIVAIAMVTSAVTALTLTDWNQFKISEDKNNSTETVTEYHYYHEAEKDDNSSQNSGGFWGNLFGGDSSDSKNSSDTNTSSNASYSSSQQNKPSTSSSGSDTNSSKNPTANGSTPSNSTPDNSTSTDITDKPAEVVKVFGNNPNNVMTSNQQLDQYETGLVAKQGEWIYFVQQYGRIMKVKTDGSDMQVVFEVSGLSFIECLNVIGDTIYYINGGVWSVKTDGTNRKQHTSKAAHNLLVRGTTGWFVEFIEQTQFSHGSSYNLYQIDFSTGDITTLVESGVGFGLKTVVGNKLIYANDLKVYSRDLSTGSEEVIFDVAAQEQDVPSTINFSIESMIMGSDYNMYIERGTNSTSYGYITYKINLNQPNVVLETYDCFDRIHNYFDHNDGAFFAIIRGSSTGFNFYDLQGNSLCEKDENLHRYTGIYTFDDGYAYYFDENRTALYRMRPDGTDIKTY